MAYHIEPSIVLFWFKFTNVLFRWVLLLISGGRLWRPILTDVLQFDAIPVHWFLMMMTMHTGLITCSMEEHWRWLRSLMPYGWFIAIRWMIRPLWTIRFVSICSGIPILQPWTRNHWQRSGLLGIFSMIFILLFSEPPGRWPGIHPRY